MNNNITFYSKHARSLAEQYNNLDPESVHKEWIKDIPDKGLALDVGAGSGRDARYLAAKGLTVVAVEPADGIREMARQYDLSNKIHWLSDSLPELTSVFKLQTKFDLILLSAVWMHIPASSRNRSIRKLSSLLKPNGRLVISLRHGMSSDERTMYPVCAGELSQLASKYGLSYQLLSEQSQQDELGRAEVTWQTVVLTLPDDGTGAFPLIRNIVVNDSKSSTYKVALLRTLLRIAEGHAGAVIDQDDEYVALPIGLVALYWMKLYKPLIDQYGMLQSSSKGLGFVRANGWQKITSHQSADFYIGASYSQDDIATSLYQTLKDICDTIRKMPVKHITLPNTEEAVFSVELFRTRKPTQTLTLDFAFLSSLGRFYVPAAIWDSLTRFSVWIEPALVHEWSALMASYSRNKVQEFSPLDYIQALSWEAPQRSTTRVRNRVKELLTTQPVRCCWSGANIQASRYAVDHAFPFARWPNNDLWNLLPSKIAINANKSDKLPTANKLASSRDNIVNWWQQAWQQNENEFFTQANFALPNLSQHNQNYNDVFEALSLQRERIKAFQQLQDW